MKNVDLAARHVSRMGSPNPTSELKTLYSTGNKPLSISHGPSDVGSPPDTISESEDDRHIKFQQEELVIKSATDAIKLKHITTTPKGEKNIRMAINVPDKIEIALSFEVSTKPSYDVKDIKNIIHIEHLFNGEEYVALDLVCDFTLSDVWIEQFNGDLSEERYQGLLGQIIYALQAVPYIEDRINDEFLDQLCSNGRSGGLEYLDHNCRLG